MTLTNNNSRLPEGPLLAFYGDDFTGSTDVMEAFTAAGIPTVLFLTPPTPKDLLKFENIRCIGLAGQSRSQDPEWMEQTFPKLFRDLAAIGAPILQYKVCSTFDSSPTIGSIGKAIDIGTQLTDCNWSPMIIGAPRLKRYQSFGQLFADAGGITYRLDRHPTMSRHPVTPMDEADLRIHLAKQTLRRLELIDLIAIKNDQAQSQLHDLSGADQPIVMIDVIDTETQVQAGRLVWENRGKQVFTASSSGLQYALAAYWKQQGWLDAAPVFTKAKSVDCIAAVSGSCSPMSAQQIEWARTQGFLCIRLNVPRVLKPASHETEILDLSNQSIHALQNGLSPIVYSALGPDDPEVLNFDRYANAANLSRAQAAFQIGQVLAEIMRRILDGSKVKRIVVAGGDSSGAVGSHLGIKALTVAANLAPGVPLCRAWSDNASRDGLEIALKGGQLGGIEFYGLVRTGLTDG
jgi:uncharacterized protein YgbK (DUF1537 family)